MLGHAGLQIAANTTAQNAATSAAKVTTGWAAMASASAHGDLGCVASAANSRITVTQGVYLVNFTASVEQAGTSGESPAGVVYETSFQVYKDQAAVSGLKATIDSDTAEQSLKQIAITGIVEVAADVNGQLEIFFVGTHANDIIIREAQFTVLKIR